MNDIEKGIREMLGLIETQRAEISFLRKKNNWQTIESAPKDGTKIDLWVVFERTGAMRITDCYWNKMLDDWQLTDNNAADYMVRPKIEYWMPVPMLPNNKKPA